MKKNYSKKTIKSLGGTIFLLLVATLLVGAAAYTYFVRIGETDNVNVNTILQYSLDEGVSWLDCGDVDLTLTFNGFPGDTATTTVMFKLLGDDTLTITPIVVDDQINLVYGKMYEDTTEITSFDLIPEDIDIRTIDFVIETDQLTPPGVYTVTYTIDSFVVTGGGG